MPPVGPAPRPDGLQAVLVRRAEIPQPVPEILFGAGPGAGSGRVLRTGKIRYRRVSPQLAERFLRRIGGDVGGSLLRLIVNKIVLHFGTVVLLFSPGKGTESGHEAHLLLFRTVPDGFPARGTVSSEA